MNEHNRTIMSTGLTAGETELAYMLIEEAGEVITAATKLLRHGAWNHHPDKLPDETNIRALFREINDFRAVAEMFGAPVVDLEPMKAKKLQWSRYQRLSDLTPEKPDDPC